MKKLLKFIGIVLGVLIGAPLVLVIIFGMMAPSAEEKAARHDVLLPKVQALPARDIAGNLKGYKELASLAPDNEVYKEKVAFYKAALAVQQAKEDQARATALSAAKAKKAAADRRNRLRLDTQVKCQMLVERSSKFPGKADFKMFSTQQFSNAFKGEVDLMNGFGMMIPHVYTCRFDPETFTIEDLDVVPGTL